MASIGSCEMNCWKPRAWRLLVLGISLVLVGIDIVPSYAQQSSQSPRQAPSTSRPPDKPPSPSTATPAPTPKQPNPSIWQLSQDDRQKLLAEQMRQAALTQQTSVDLQQQINQAYALQQQALAAAQQAQIEAIQAQQQAATAGQAAVQEANAAGLKKAEFEGASTNLPKQLDMVTSSLKSWEPPKRYEASSSARVALADPFSQKPELAANNHLANIEEAVQGTCLELDKERGLGRVAKECLADGRTLPFEKGDYPLLPDGNLLDSTARIKTFLENYPKSDSRLFVLRGDGQMARLR